MKKIIIFGSKGVGKSTLYQKIKLFFKSGEKKNYTVSPHINYVEEIIKLKNYSLHLIDTVSFDFANKFDDLVTKEIKILNDDLISTCDKIIWLVDSSSEFLSNYNLSIQEYLEKKQKEYFIVFNKFNFEIINKEEYLNDYDVQKMLKKNIKYYFLPSLNSTEWNENFKTLIASEFNFEDRKQIENKDEEIDFGNFFKLTIFGPPNSGKSTLLNSLLDYQRSVVSSLEGTTKEEVITKWSWKDFQFQIKDTEGVINQKRNNVLILKDCQISWVVIDVNEQITKQTLQIISLAEKCEKAILIILNKVDLCDDYQIELKKKEIRSRMKSFSFVPIICISAKKKKNFNILFGSLSEIIKQSKLQFKKSEIASQFDLILKKNPPSSIRGKRLKVYYSIHEGGLVHKFITFVNNPNLVHFSYHRYIVNNLRKNLEIKILPIKIIFKKS